MNLQLIGSEIFIFYFVNMIFSLHNRFYETISSQQHNNNNNNSKLSETFCNLVLRFYLFLTYLIMFLLNIISYIIQLTILILLVLFKDTNMTSVVID